MADEIVVEEAREVVPVGAALAQRFNEVERGGGSGPTMLSPEVAQQFSAMISLLPIEDGSQATERIAEAILNASDLDGLNAPWRSDNTDGVLDRVLVIDGAKVLPSQYEDGWGAFLYVHALDAKTGEDASYTTSSWSITLQIVAANAMDMLPIRAKVVKADRPSSRGYYPKHLEVLAAHASVTRVTQAREQ